jgi:predicted transcriptional regulator
VGRALADRRPLADTTIHTVLANLRKKGYIEPIPTVERVLRYAPRVPREQVATRSLRQIMRDFFGDSPGRLMAHLMSEEKVDRAELTEIRKMLAPKAGKKEKES